MKVTNSISQQTVGDRRPQAKIGKPVYEAYYSKTVINRASQAVNIWTFQLTGGYSDGRSYTVTINGIDVTYVATTADTDLTGVCVSFIALINNTGLVAAQVVATSLVDVITITGLLESFPITVTEADANIGNPVETQSEVAASVVPFGRAMVSQGYVTDEADELGTLAGQPLFTAQVTTLTVPYVAGTIVTVGVTVNGVRYQGTTTMATAATNTIDALVAVLNAIVPANTVLFANSAGTELSATAEVLGLTFVLDWGVDDSGATDPVLVIATDNTGIATSLEESFVGVSIYSMRDENTEIEGETYVYRANAGVESMGAGQIFVQNVAGATPDKGDEVWVDVTNAATLGRFYTAADGTDRVRLPQSHAVWERNGRTLTGSTQVAVINVKYAA